MERDALDGIPADIRGLPDAVSAETEAAREAIMACVQQACHVSVADAINVQARRPADLMVSQSCRNGQVGTEYSRTMRV